VLVHGIARYDGSSWSALPNTLDAYGDMVSFDDGEGDGPALYATSSFVEGGVTKYAVARFDGASWTHPAPSFDASATRLAVLGDGNDGETTLYAVGNFGLAGSSASARIARLVRSNAIGCESTTGEAFCFGDGSGVACPCANNGASGNGCDNSA